MSIPQTIELDCAPCVPRPDSYIEDVIQGLGLPEKDLDSRIKTKCFGNWLWDFSDVDADIWQKARPTMKERVEALYQAGSIRYGSW